MSGECDQCGDHATECKCNENMNDSIKEEHVPNSQIGFRYAMPFGETLEVRSNRISEQEDDFIDKEVDGVFYFIYWNKKKMPWVSTTLVQATAIALGCQWGAFETSNRFSTFGS